MECPKCQTKNPEENSFCRECGAKLLLACPQCGAEFLHGDKFCGKCGHNLHLPSEPSPTEPPFDEKIAKIQKYLPKGLTEKILSQRDRIEGERKQVTVMFCDMEEFTPLSERLGPEEAYSIMDQVYEILIHKVHDYEGTVNEMTGDGILALFGAPIALEDAPQRAVRSAMAIHREMSRFSERMKQEMKGIPPLIMRVGIHTGPVVVGTLGNDLRVEFKAVGDTVNLASRMEGLAEPGTTYVSEDTFKLTEGFFRFEALGEKEVKGKTETVKVYRVIAPSTRRTRFDVSAERGLTPFVGRERELELLLDGFERSKAGRGQAFSVMAEAGTGKSRLLYEFRKAVTNQYITFLEGKCLSYSRGVAYHPVIDILKANFDVLEGDRDAEIREKVKRGLKTLGLDEAFTLPYFLELLSVKDSGIDKIPMSPEAKKDRIMEALKQIVLKGSEIRPLILAYEDLHWADKTSEDVLKYVLESIPGARVLMLFTYRPEFVHTWGGKSYHNQVTLNRLSNRESLTMVSHLLGTEDIDSDLEELILEKTEGVPFFIEEFIKSLKDLNIIEREDKKYRLAKDIQEVTIPSTIQDVTMARVDSLPEGAKELLQIGSVIEREFSYELIKRATGLLEQEILSHLSVLKDSELLYERGIYPETTYIFKHALTREVVYDSILTHRKKKLHEEIGDAIEELCRENIDEYYEALAHHYSNTTHLEKAIHYLELAGDRATKYFSLGEARKLYRAAIGFLDSLKKSRDITDSYIDLSLKWAEVSHYVASEEHLKILETSLQYAQNFQDETRLAKTTYWMGRMYYSLGKMVQSLPCFEQCIEMAGELRDEEMLALPYNVIGRTCLFTSEWTKGVDYLEKGIPMLERLGNLDEVNYSTGLLGTIYGFMGDFEKAVYLTNKALEISINTGNKTREALSCIYLEAINCVRGSWNDALKHGTQAIEISRQIENPVIEGLGIWLMGYATFHEKRRQKGIDMLRAGIEKIEATGSTFTLGLGYGWRAEAHALTGQKEEAEFCASKAFDLAKIGERWGEVLAYRALAIGGAKKKPTDWNKVDIHMGESLRWAEERGDRPGQAIGCFQYASLLHDKGDLGQAKKYLKQAEDLTKEMNMAWWLEQTKELKEKL